MSPVSAADAEMARKYLALSLQKISTVGQCHMATLLNTSEATISRFVANDLERACRVMAVLGLKVVPAELQVYEPRKVAILMELARDHLNQLETPDQLSFT